MAGEKEVSKPANNGWDNLSIDERLNIWWYDNREKMGNQAERYKKFLENFTSGYDEANIEVYLNFKYDLKLYRYNHPDLLLDGFNAIYDTSAEQLGAQGAEPRYRLTAYMKVSESYYASREDAESDKAHYEGMEGDKPMNVYVVEDVSNKTS